ncbi:PKD domain-containing protein [Mycena latifolia]|nr:PKD domain-containing protein [Mycena latifolia]
MRFAFTGAFVAVASQLVGASLPSAKPSLLIFTKTEGYRHESIPFGIDLVTSIAKENKWAVAATEDSSVFTTPDGLSAYKTLVFISTTGNFLTPAESDGLEQFLLNGGTWLGIHAAGDFGDDMPAWYRTLVGGQFLAHPCVYICSDADRAEWPPYGNVRPTYVLIEDSHHPSTRPLPVNYTRDDEWYSYKTNPSQDPHYHVLATINQEYVAVSDNMTNTPDHPISWVSLFEGKSRAFYTGMGHTNESYSEPYFIDHVTGGLKWVTGVQN